MRKWTLFLALTLAGGCVSKGKYSELEDMYNSAVEERDKAAAERDRAEDQLAQVRERNRNRLEKFAAVYKELLEIEKKELAKVRIEDGRAVLQLESDVLFASGSAQLTPDGNKTVQDIAKILADGTSGKFQVEGHTDTDAINSKEFPTNWHLGADRAINVTAAMIEAGLQPERVSAATYGQHAPVAANDTKETKAQNRRIEIVAVPELSEVLPYKRMMKELEEGESGGKGKKKAE
jgi:chemotaxis protein MotB